MGVIIAAGMMGGLALFLAEMTKQQHVTQRKAETGTELTALHHKILAIFYDGDSCTATLEQLGNPLPFSTVSGKTLGELRNRSGTVVVKTGPSGDINRLLRVKSMTINNPRGSGSTRELDVVVVVKKLSRAVTGHDETVKTFPITVELDSSDNILRCHHTLDAKEHGIKSRMCTDMGGQMVCPGGINITRCSIDNLYRRFCQQMGGNYTPHPSMKCDISHLYVDTAGDTMTGDLGTKNLSATSGVFSGNVGAKNIIAIEKIKGAQGEFTGDIKANNINANIRVSTP